MDTLFLKNTDNTEKIEKADTDRLLGAIAAYFGNEYDEIFAIDIGNWVMELTNTEGKTYKFRGCCVPISIIKVRICPTLCAIL